MPKSFPRTGAWTTVGKKTGIIAEYPQRVRQQHADGSPKVDEQGNTKYDLDYESAVVHITDADGNFGHELRNVPAGSLKLASLADIPKARLKGDSGKLAKVLGYA